MKGNFHYAAMHMMTSQILRNLWISHTQKKLISRMKHYFFLKFSVITHQGILYCKTNFVEVTFKVLHVLIFVPGIYSAVLVDSETAVQWCSLKTAVLNILQNFEENKRGVIQY